MIGSTVLIIIAGKAIEKDPGASAYYARDLWELIVYLEMCFGPTCAARQVTAGRARQQSPFIHARLELEWRDGRQRRGWFWFQRRPRPRVERPAG